MYSKVGRFYANSVLKKHWTKNYHSDNVFGFKRKTKSDYKAPVRVLENKESNFFRLITAYRQHAHKSADINPVSLAGNAPALPELDPKSYNLSDDDSVRFAGLIGIGKETGTVKEAVDFLDSIYKKQIGVEFMHLENAEEIEWFSKRTEELVSSQLDGPTKLKIGTEMIRSQNFDNFLANKFPGVKRYGGEGAESMITFFVEFLYLCGKENLEQVVLVMTHRGRLNLLTGLLNFPPVRMFTKLTGRSTIPSTYRACGDVLNHFVSSTDIEIEGKKFHLSMLYNPSHLESANPVSLGKTRAKQMAANDGDYGDGKWADKIINVQVHGDAAIMGQGVNQECLAMSRTPHFEIGGTIHLVTNNQLGFTTPGERGRSSRYCTDVAKIISAPVIHVNGDYPEMAVKATRLAFEYHRKFRTDIFIDLNCFRQWGHNELDDPTFTNPALYSKIRSRRTVPDQYFDKLIAEGVLKQETKDQIIQDHTKWLNKHLQRVETYKPRDIYFKGQWEGIQQGEEAITTWDTGIHLDLMTFVGSKSVQFPEHFNIHPTLLRSHVKNRLARVAEGVAIDWATAEALAIGSLLHDGHNVRFSGEDVGRGTFSHRHVMLVDQKTNLTYIPLNHIHPNQGGFLEVANSILSEEAVLGYEYGMSIENPKNLIVWEAQFGDFFDGAQIIFDTFITNGETKWLWGSGLVVLLPHGYDGMGPEHSSARVERFLQLTDSQEDAVDGDSVNMQVCQPTTAAQYFHLLRRQMVRNFRTPLIIITPKTLLRLADAGSNFADMAAGTSFRPVLPDTDVDASNVERVLLTAGRHFYTLAEQRKSLGSTNTAIVRMESFCPFPTLELREEVARYAKATTFVWCQEEPRNMGAWSFVRPRFENLVGKKLQYCGRAAHASPAVGIMDLHRKEVEHITKKPFTM